MKKLVTLMSIFSIQQLSATPSAKPINTNRKEIPVISQSQVVQGKSCAKGGSAIAQHVQYLRNQMYTDQKIDAELEWAKMQFLIMFDAMVTRDLKPIDQMIGTKMFAEGLLSLFAEGVLSLRLSNFYVEKKEKAGSSKAASPTRYQLRKSADKKLSAKPDDDSKTKREKENDDSTPQETNKNTLFLNKYHSAGCWPIDL